MRDNFHKNLKTENSCYKTVIDFFRNEHHCRILLYFVYAIFMFAIHLTMTYVSDDLVVSATIKNQTLLENFMERWKYNGRIFTDVLANLFYRFPMIVWKIFDVGIYVIMVLLITKSFTDNTLLDLVTVCVLMILFPIRYLSSAGWIATTTNYIYTVLGLLYIVYFLKRLIHNSINSVITNILLYTLITISILYVTNHDQTAMVLIGGLLVYFTYLLIEKESNKKLTKTVGCILAFSIISYLFMLLIPGHTNRMTSTAEMERFLPQFAEWSFAKKVYEGYSTTVANLFFGDVELFSVFCILILILGLKNKYIINKVIALIPSGVIFLGNYIGKHRFVVYESYSYDMPDLINPSANIIPLLLTVIAVFSIFWTVAMCVKNNRRKLFILLLLMLSAGSREMMGFSATIFGSSFRTFTFFLFALIVCNIMILRELKEDRDENWYFNAAYGAIAAVLIS